MRTIVHLSDVHFGRADERVVPELVQAVHNLQPDLVVVSGDLTQRARPKEFRSARDFLNLLPQPQIVVPGNHDVPLHDVFDRFYRALDDYRVYITDDLEPFYSDDAIAVLGINTARSLTLKGGRINEEQIAVVEERFGNAAGLKKILVTHHPFDLPENYDEGTLVGRAQQAMTRFASCGIDLLLAGHLHLTYSGPTAVRYSAGGFSSIFVQAGTACSTRQRGEPNSFNCLRIREKDIEIESHSSLGAAPFQLTSTQNFALAETGWNPQSL